jgi:hypothetical protein
LIFLLCWSLCFLQLLALLGRDLAVGLGLGFLLFHLCLALVQSGRFLAGQLARRDALIDALLLVCLALVDLGCAGLRQNGQRNNGKGSDQQTGMCVSFGAPGN